MVKCPMAFEHPNAAQALDGLGPKLCQRLAEKLEEHCRQNGLPMPTKTPQKRRTTMAQDIAEEEALGSTTGTAEERPKKRIRKQKEYVPKIRSGAYALIMALGTLDKTRGNRSLSKDELVEIAQPWCDASFTVTERTSAGQKWITAWKAMQSLLDKELVCIVGHPIKRYTLTDDGWELVSRMQATERVHKTSSRSRVAKTTSTSINALVSSTSVEVLNSVSDDESQTLPGRLDRGMQDEHCASEFISIRDSRVSGGGLTAEERRISPPIALSAGTFEVQLLLDVREIRTPSDRDYLKNELIKRGVRPDIRSLPLGDFLWIAKPKPPYDSAFRTQNWGDEEGKGGDEIVLEHVIERKRLDDLLGSIKDGRFHEQKFRLQKSGMRHVTYLVEDYSLSSEKQDRYGESLESAIAQMQTVYDIFVKQTDKIADTAAYVARMTMSLKEMYEQKDLHVLPSRSLDLSTYLSTLDNLRNETPANSYCITMSAFSAICNKSDSLQLRDLYLKMLMCMRGVTGDKAVEIQKIWPTPRALIEAYAARSGDRAARDNLISEQLGSAIPRKKIQKVLSTRIAEVWAG